MFNLLHHFTCGLLLFSLNKKYTQASSFTAGPSGGSWHLTTVGETKTQLKSNLLLVSLRREVVLILALTSSPYQQILPFFPDMLAQELTGELMGGVRGKEKYSKGGGGDSPRAGGRYRMHVHSSVRFVASCLRIFLGSQDYLQSQ